MTLAIGFLIPSNHHVLHCRCQTYYVGCLLVGDLLLAINQSYGSLIAGLPCLALGKKVSFTICAFYINKMSREKKIVIATKTNARSHRKKNSNENGKQISYVCSHEYKLMKCLF